MIDEEKIYLSTHVILSADVMLSTYARVIRGGRAGNVKIGRRQGYNYPALVQQDNPSNCTLLFLKHLALVLLT